MPSPNPAALDFLMTLEKIDFEFIDMKTVVIIGNSQTFIWNDRMITPRGYSSKYNLTETSGQE